jgi:hypothetical protein
MDLQAPQADLYDASGRLVVRHGAGPSWEALDGSRITGKLLQHAANPDDSAAIPMLLLSSTNAGGPGLLSTVHYVQRLATHGGAAPRKPASTRARKGAPISRSTCSSNERSASARGLCGRAVLPLAQPL